MVRNKQILCALLFTILSMPTMAQNNTNSPYTRYGYGQLSDQNSAKNKAMGGAGYGVRDGMQINLLNPASYSAVDSLTMLFDGGITLQNTNFSDGTVKLNAKNSSFDYAAMQMRLRPGLGLTFGIKPFSNVGYNLSSTIESSEIPTHQIIYSGDGGIQQAFLGLGYRVLPQLSVGVNASYMWGNIDRITQMYVPSSTNIYGSRETYNLTVHDFRFDFGAQYTHRFTKKSSLTLGAVFSPGQDLSNDATVTNEKMLGDTPQNRYITDIEAAFSIPASFGVGLAYNYDQRLTLAMDYNREEWSKCKYMDDENAFANRQKISAGLEYVPNHMSRRYLAHVKYRLGAYYSKPYYNIKLNNNAGYGSADEYGISGGVALPLLRTRSLINIGAQYVQVKGKGMNMLDEKYLRVSIGITFNERWFFKRKVD